MTGGVFYIDHVFDLSNHTMAFKETSCF